MIWIFFEKPGNLFVTKCLTPTTGQVVIRKVMKSPVNALRELYKLFHNFWDTIAELAITTCKALLKLPQREEQSQNERSE